MSDNGFARAQAAYDAQEPPDHTEAFERYVDRYNTVENRKMLAVAMADSASNVTSERNDKPGISFGPGASASLATAILQWLNDQDAGDVCDWMAEADVIPVKFEDYTDDDEDDGPDPDRERDEAMDREYDREPF